MKLELEDSFNKRAWVAMAYDARSRKACWEWVEREDFHEPTFYLIDSGIYCVSGKDPSTDRNRWLTVENGKGAWREYKDVENSVSAGNAKVQLFPRAQQATEYRCYICRQCDETFGTLDGTEPFRRLIDWTENNDPIYEPICPTCAEAREWEKSYHKHFCYCGHEYWAEESQSDCDECRDDATQTFCCGCELCREYFWSLEEKADEERRRDL